ncbi:MAG TPA: hypothetical protein VG474_15095 [Solirubrobacteraceae bacterium]|nr:hypothetical protein [Solirubrobacteraceae bacterium]
MHDPDSRRHRALVAERRARGDALYADRHRSAATGQLRRATSELADTHVYIGLERERIRHGGELTAGRLHAFDRLLDHTRRIGEQLAAATREICDPSVDFDAVRAERAAYGERTFGERYLQRDNLHEALEEIADAQIFIALHADRLRHRGRHDDAVQQLLVDANDAVDALAQDVMALQAALRQPGCDPAVEAVAP